MSLLTPHAPHKLRQIMRHGVFYLLLLLNIAASTAWAADYGDAPSTMASIDSNLSTTYGDAWHTISGTIRLGANIDNEAGSQSTGLLANGDGADDDGVAFPLLGGNRVLFAAQSTNLTITTGSNGYLNAWIDWNQDGDWNDAGEQVATNVAMTTGSNTLSVTANDSVPHGVSYARFRFTSYSVASPSPLGAATDGEVEDYRFNLLLAKPLGACLGIGNSGFEQPGGFTSFYKPTENLVPYWSTVPNNPADGNSFITHNNIELWETGFYNIPSYEGRYFAELNADVAGTLYQDTETSPGTLLYWSFAHRGRYTNDTINLKIGSPGSEVLIGNFTTGASAWKVYSGTYTVPAGQHITRFAFQAANGVSYGNFLDSIDFKTECPDWSDAPASYGDVSHQQVLGMKLGTSFTTDAGAYHDADANADPSDDGVTFSSMALGQTATINVAVSNSTGFLQAWADLNNNGTFDTGEQIAANARDGSSLDKDNVVNGIIRLNVPIPLTYPSDYLFTRFRWASASNLGASGSATDGEVEDYKTTIIRTDFGDAPSSYGSAVHSITSNLYLGSNNLDAEAVAATPLNGSGDNVSGSNDEDGIVQLPSLTTLSTSAYITVNVTNTTGQKAWLVGWIDLNGNGVFDPSEAQTLPIPTGASNKQVGLNWSGLTGLSVGTTYLRLRLTTDTSIATGSASTSQATGSATDGEVEDYALTITNGGYTVSGTVFHDTNVNAANDSEAGLKEVTVVLYNTLAHTCVATRTNADGQYRFNQVANGSYHLYEAGKTVISTSMACPPAANDPVGYTSSTPNQLALTVANANVAGQDFGDVQAPSFTLDNEKAILPNSTIAYPHGFRTPVAGAVAFSITTTQASPSDLIWGQQLLIDTNCDGMLNTGDTPYTTPLALNAGDKVCLLVKVTAPSNASAGALLELTVQSDFTYGDGALGIAATVQTHTDLTTTAAGTTQSPVDGAGKLQLNKSVWNVTRNSAGEVAKPGETLRYTIAYENIGNGTLNTLVIHDRVPEFTDLVTGSLQCNDTPPEISSCTPTATGDTLMWNFSGNLPAGQYGEVYYDTLIK